MHRPWDALIDIVISITILTLSIGTILSACKYLLSSPNLGFGVLEDKTTIESNIEYNRFNRFSSVNWYQMMCIPLVNDYSQEFYTYAALTDSTSTETLDKAEAWNNRFKNIYWFKAKNIYSTNLIDLDARLMPKEAMKEDEDRTKMLYTISLNYFPGVTKDNDYADIYLYSVGEKDN